MDYMVDLASGVAVACAIKAALEKHEIAGKIVLLGTPGGCKLVSTENSLMSL